MIWPDWLNLWPSPVTPSDNEGNCQLLGPFAVIVQFSMGIAAVLSLVFKRSREHPRRPWWIWFFDVSKQIIGAGGLHSVNVLASILFSSTTDPGVDKNPCNWYFLNILLDTTIGVPVLWFFLYLIHTGFFRLGMKGIVSGQYGNPPKWSYFFKQAWLYMIALMCMKCVLYIFVWWMPFMDDLGEFLISWTNFDERVQVAFVMMIFPLVMNSLQYYLIDSIIQSPEYHHQESGDEESGIKDDDSRRALLSGSDSGSSSTYYDGIVNESSRSKSKHVSTKSRLSGEVDDEDTETEETNPTLPFSSGNASVSSALTVTSGSYRKTGSPSSSSSSSSL